MSRAPESPHDLPPAGAGRLFVFEQPGHHGRPGCWRIASLLPGEPLRPWPAHYVSQEIARACAQQYAQEHGLRVLLAVPRFTARLR